MRIALNEARRGDYPFGAVIVKDGKLLALGRNLGKTHDDPTAHGEMIAIRRCLAVHGSAPLKGATLYTSGEPCVMCMGAIIWCGVGRLVYAASVAQIGAKMNQIMIDERRYRRQGAVGSRQHHRRRARRRSGADLGAVDAPFPGRSAARSEAE